VAPLSIGTEPLNRSSCPAVHASNVRTALAVA
jgi:hypothetical protein